MLREQRKVRIQEEKLQSLKEQKHKLEDQQDQKILKLVNPEEDNFLNRKKQVLPVLRPEKQQQQPLKLKEIVKY